MAAFDAKPEARRELGQYSTPLLTVDYMVKRALHLLDTHHRTISDTTPVVTSSLRILDPSTGDGVFVERLLAHGVDPNSITAYDMDPRVIEQHHWIPGLEERDFLAPFLTNQTFAGTYDLIIGNPPYKSRRESTYIQQHFSRLKQQFSDIGVHNLYAMFMRQAIEQLREGGILCMIVQDSFLTNVYYRHFRRFLLDHCLIHEIVLAPRRLFHQASADVRTAIVTLQKCTAQTTQARQQRLQHTMRLVDRLRSETDYFDPPTTSVQELPQHYYERLESHSFCINVPESILTLMIAAKERIGDRVAGGTGISTGNDAMFLRTKDELSLEEAEEWVPFYKNGGPDDAWYYETPYRIHRDWYAMQQTFPTYLARNTECYFLEGITCSSMGIRFTAAYLPAGCLFGVNTNLIPHQREDLFYLLALLNSRLGTYMIRAIANRTNMVTAGYIKRLPYVEPKESVKSHIVELAKQLVDHRRTSRGPHHTCSLCNETQAALDQQMEDVYEIPLADRKTIATFVSELFESL